jgi:hypothetical protein
MVESAVAERPVSAVHTAIARAAANYAPYEWGGLAPAHRTDAIYRELRELDAAVARLQAVADHHEGLSASVQGSPRN